MKINRNSIQLSLSKKSSVISIKGKAYWQNESRGRIQKEVRCERRASGVARRAARADRQLERHECDISIWVYIIHGNALKALAYKSLSAAEAGARGE